MTSDATQPSIPALLSSEDHNRCSSGWLSAQIRALRAELQRGEQCRGRRMTIAEVIKRLDQILGGKEQP